MIQSSDFDIGDVVNVMGPDFSSGNDEAATVLGFTSATHLELRFADGRVENRPAQMATLVWRTGTGPKN